MKKAQSSEEQLSNLRHTCSHVLAAVLIKLYPGIKLGIGPVIEHGFYYDVDSPTPITDKDLPAIEKAMKKYISGSAAMTGEEVTVNEARDRQYDQPYKLELIDEFAEEGKKLTLYTLGDFTDLCKGGHLENTKQINADAIQLTHVAGAYWRGDEHKPMLTRIYGLAFASRQELDAHLALLAEAEKRDHRKLGQELGLFFFSPLVGSGLPLFTPKGTVLRTELEKLVWEVQLKRGYTRVNIPHLAKPELYKKSGHWDKFADDIFHVFGKNHAEFVMKPMNCPHHSQIYKFLNPSYRDLPLRLAEVTTVYRDENPGQLQGLSRVRSITQDDAHVFCRPDQIEEEIMMMFDMADEIYRIYGITLEPTLSVRDSEQSEKYLGTDDLWRDAEQTLKEVLNNRGVKNYSLDVGGAAFYGPKIDLFGVDAIGRKWQLSTFQLDFNQPQGLDLTYVDANGKDIRPVMIHRALFGAIERHLSVIIEHYAGAFPVWLSPVHVELLPVSDKHIEFAETVARELRAKDIRVEVDDRNETIGNKIRKAAKQKIPYIIVLGDKEAETGMLPIRSRGSKETVDMPREEFITKITSQIRERSAEL